jgi:hypothetical protein
MNNYVEETVKEIEKTIEPIKERQFAYVYDEEIFNDIAIQLHAYKHDVPLENRDAYMQIVIDLFQFEFAKLESKYGIPRSTCFSLRCKLCNIGTDAFN